MYSNHASRYGAKALSEVDMNVKKSLSMEEPQ